jgi:DNA-binding MarR family transcriptional regulator
MSESRLPQLVERLGGLLRARARRQGAAFGLQPVHLQVLDYLARCNRFSNTPAALTAYLQATKGTVSQSLKLLEERALLLREPDADDRRVLRLSLTGEGRAVLQQLAADDALGAVIAGQDVAAVAAAEQVLENCLRALQRDSGFDGFGQCRSCRHLCRPQAGEFSCGLTGEPLALVETGQLCQEHGWPVVG